MDPFFVHTLALRAGLNSREAEGLGLDPVWKKGKGKREMRMRRLVAEIFRTGARLTNVVQHGSALSTRTKRSVNGAVWR